MRTLKCLLVVAIVAIAAPYASAQSCTPPGWQPLGGGGLGYQYDWIANGQPLSSNCWLSNAPVITTSECGNSQMWFNFDNSTDSITQYPEIPPYAQTGMTRFNLTYLLTKIDPNHSYSGTKLKAEVVDEQTGIILATQTYRGSDPDVTCARRDLNFTFVAPANGADFRVRFSGGSTFANATVRVRSIALIEY